MRRPLRIALFADASPLFINVLSGLARALTALGAETHVGWPLMDGRLLSSFTANFHPDVIIEINRTRDSIHGCDSRFIHIGWIHDFQYNGKILDKIGGSHLTYFMLPPEIYGLNQLKEEWSYLWPGVDPEVFSFDESSCMWDLSLVGHMYGPPSDEAMNSRIIVNGNDIGKFQCLFEDYLNSSINHSNISLPIVHEFVTEFFTKKGEPVSISDFDKNILFIIDEYMLRVKGRLTTAHAMLKTSPKLRFFGNAGWALWPEFAPYYGGEITDPSRMANIYRSSAINIHDVVWPMHFRTLECMAAGGMMMMLEVDNAEANKAFSTWFVPGEHYIPYRQDNFTAQAHRLLNDAPERRRMARAASRAIHAAHTWEHRARQILDDLAGLQISACV